MNRAAYAETPLPVEVGSTLGYITDYFGERIAEVRSTLAGIVMYVVVSPAMGKGEPVAMVGVPRR